MQKYTCSSEGSTPSYLKNLFMIRVVVLVVCLLSKFILLAQQNTSQTANTYITPYSEQFMYGSNMGYYGNGWNDEGIAGLVGKVGGHTIRPTLPDYFVEQWGYNVRLSTFQTYVNKLGMREITCFIGEPSEAHREKTTYPGCSEPSKLFANLYTPIWNNDGSVNQNNYYAHYVYQLIQVYGPYVRFWEVVNEPDFTYGSTADWLTRAPLPSETVNMQAPIYSYIRMLRITWEVVKKYSPQSYVTTGGIGYTEFLDALLRYSDNPSDGSVTGEYPNKGGAYFDVLSFHFYPSYSLRYWNNSIGGFSYTRTSDYAVSSLIKAKGAMETTLDKYGYNGKTYPSKHFILTETNVSRRPVDDRYSSDEMQRNYNMKSLIMSQKHNIKQYYLYGVAESADAPAPSNSVPSSMEYRLMGLYENLSRDASGAEKKTQAGIGFHTTSQLLSGYTYDSTRTANLGLPNHIKGAAFIKNGLYVYALWADAKTDMSENAEATYTFPANLNIQGLQRYEWDYVVSNKVVQQSPVEIPLTGAVSFFTETNLNSLPARLLNFTAQRKNASVVQLQWHTEEEESNTKYEVQKSKDGQTFSFVATIAGRNNGSFGNKYVFEDAEGFSAAYYRLKIVKQTNEFTYSNILFVNRESSSASIQVFPNPSTGQVYVSGASNNATISVWDLNGRLLQNYTKNTKVLNLESLPLGMYVIRVLDGANITTQKILVQR